MTSRSFRAALVQCGPSSSDLVENLNHVSGLVRDAARTHRPDLIVLPELATVPYFCLVEDDAIFDWAEHLDGRTVETFSSICREFSVNLVAPLFERGRANGEYYDSAVVLDRTGDVVLGRLPSGDLVTAMRKVHLSCHADYEPPINEKLYFRGGPGFPLFSVDDVQIGCLICYDRSFPEAWRTVALAGGDVVVVPAASFAPRRAAHFVEELSVASTQNGVFCLAANKAGIEKFGGASVEFFGLSAAIDPFGQRISVASLNEPDEVILADLDLSLNETWGRRYHYMRDRRPEAYSLESASRGGRRS
jgi:predicted amidohydrolase